MFSNAQGERSSEKHGGQWYATSMTDIVRAIVLGVVQGITEFLPVSSDGHLLLVRHLFGWADEGLSFDTVLHLGTFFAVFIVFRKTWWRLLCSILPAGSSQDRRLLSLIVLATIPGAAIGYFGESLVASTFRGLRVTAGGFLVSAIFLWLADIVQRRSMRERSASSASLTPLRAVSVGILQVFALLPGLSRSGSTIAGGMFVGLTREAAVEFSFLLALPIVGGAGAHGLLKWGENGAHNPVALGVGALAAFLSGLWAIRMLQRLAKRQSFMPFVIYLVLVAALTWMLGR